jgi:hypothetical protein
MAPNPPEATRRLRLELKIDNQTQFTQLRVSESVVGSWEDTVATAFVDWLTILLTGSSLEGAGNESQIDLLSAQSAEIGSEIFLPVTVSALGEVQTGAGSATPLSAASLCSFSGRSIGGVARFFLRGLRISFDGSGYADFRISGAENSSVQDALDDLLPAGNLGQYLIGTDNMGILYWRPYMNVSFSRAYINHARSV